MLHQSIYLQAYGPVGEKLLPVDPKGNSDEIRFRCKASCIEECFSKKQTESKLYFDSDQGESWLPDNHFSFKCTLGNKIKQYNIYTRKMFRNIMSDLILKFVFTNF